MDAVCRLLIVEHGRVSTGSVVVIQAFVALHHMESFWSRNQAHVPCRRTLNHWTTREIRLHVILFNTMLQGATFSLKDRVVNTAGLPYPWVLHLWIQPTTARIPS